jgi:hypothetical protein
MLENTIDAANQIAPSRHPATTVCPSQEVRTGWSACFSFDAGPSWSRPRWKASCGQCKMQSLTSRKFSVKTGFLSLVCRPQNIPVNSAHYRKHAQCEGFYLHGRVCFQPLDGRGFLTGTRHSEPSASPRRACASLGEKLMIKLA